MLIAILVWLIFSILVGVAAERRGRSGIGWVFFALLLSPLIAAIVLALLPDPKYQRAMRRLAAYERGETPNELKKSIQRR
jgi:hypothetical protein